MDFDKMVSDFMKLLDEFLETAMTFAEHPLPVQKNIRELMSTHVNLEDALGEVQQAYNRIIDALVDSKVKRVRARHLLSMLQQHGPPKFSTYRKLLNERMALIGEVESILTLKKASLETSLTTLRSLLASKKFYDAG